MSLSLIKVLLALIIVLFITSTALTVGSLCKNWYHINQYQEIKNDIYDFSLFDFKQTIIYSNNTVVEKDLSYFNNVFQSSFNTVASFECISLAIKLIWLASIIIFAINHSSVVAQKFIFILGISTFLTQLIGFLSIFSVTANFKDQNFGRCEGKYYCESFFDESEIYTGNGTVIPNSLMEYGPSKGFYIGLASLVILFANQFLCGIISYLKPTKPIIKNRYGEEVVEEKKQNDML